MKYLGVMIDCSLIWTKHLDYIASKISKTMNAMLSIAHKEWGFSGKAITMLNKACIEPAILYGAPFWGEKIDNINFKRKIQSIQRLILIRMCRAYRTTSNAALQVLAGCTPLYLKVKMLTWTWTFNNIQITKEGLNNLTKYADIGCLPNLDYNFLQTFVNNGIIKEKSKYVHPTNNYKADITDINAEPYPTNFIFTDGSKNNRNVGASFIHFKHGNANFKHEAGFKLASYCSVPDAELYAIFQAISYIYTLKDYKGHLRICTDSQTSLRRINSDYFDCDMINNIRNKLKNIHNYKISFAWVKGRSGVQGNEEADRLAKSMLMRIVRSSILLLPRRTSRI
ncbi:uncharacterized protein LOC111619467 [Centruroides sculpturatus]|uniref:uncharacterized protein LOC111619467 n=1 Tax=Centruroides sculpturatus TaxID=218467 RepID=UPI000C6E67C7|nr:uncharacterized protein LOC111619467 [Centruroides sculpturatus]